MGQASAGLPEGRGQASKQILSQRVFDVKEVEEEADREDEYKQGASDHAVGGTYKHSQGLAPQAQTGAHVPEPLGGGTHFCSR
jgi:hypothetical protein